MRLSLVLGVLDAALAVLPALAVGASSPPGATARCHDGTYSYSQNHSGTCSHHGRVAVWLDHNPSVPHPANSASSDATVQGSRPLAIAIFPSAGEAKYDARTTVTKLGSTWAGVLGGARATYRDWGKGQPQATILVYLFRSGTSATGGLAQSCP